MTALISWTTITTPNPTRRGFKTALSTGESYGYDANGNMTSRTEGGLTYAQTFDAENRLVSVTVSGQTTQFVYAGDGDLVKKIKPDGSKTLYVGGIYEVDKNSGGTVTGTKTYYPVAGAMRINSTLYFVLKDHLGSASVVTNKSGVIQGEDRFYPFGETRFTTGTMYTDKLFTGQREMAGLGIYHYGARFYSPKLGRFLSADTIVPGYANPQNLNRFSYVRNNPLRYIDPTGHLIDEGCGCGNTGTTRRTSISVVAGRRTTNSDRGRTFVQMPDPLVLPTVMPTDDNNSSGGGDPLASDLNLGGGRPEPSLDTTETNNCNGLESGVTRCEIYISPDEVDEIEEILIGSTVAAFLIYEAGLVGLGSRASAAFGIAGGIVGGIAGIYDGWVLNTNMLSEIQYAADTGQPLIIETAPPWGFIVGRPNEEQGTWANTIGPIIATETIMVLEMGGVLPLRP